MISRRLKQLFWMIATCFFGIIYADAQQQDRIGSVHYSPDGKWIAVSGGVAGCDDLPSADYGVRIFDADTAELAQTLLGMTCTSTSVSWSPDSQYVASINVAEAIVYIWNVASGQLERQLPARVQGAVGIKWSPEGNWIAVSAYGDFTLVLDVMTGNRAFSFAGSAFDWGGSDQIAAGASADVGGFSVQEVDAAYDVRSVVDFDLSAFPNAVIDLDWNVSANLVAQITADNIVRLADPATGLQIREFFVPNLTDARIDPTGNRLATVSLDGRIDIWRIDDGTLERSITNLSEVYTMAWSPTGVELAYFNVSTGTVVIEDVADTLMLQDSPSPTPAPTPTPTNTPLPSLPECNGTVILADSVATFNVRISSTPGSSIIATLQQNALVVVLGAHRNSYYVRYSGNSSDIGWIHDQNAIRFSDCVTPSMARRKQY